MRPKALNPNIGFLNYFTLETHLIMGHQTPLTSFGILIFRKTSKTNTMTGDGFNKILKNNLQEKSSKMVGRTPNTNISSLSKVKILNQEKKKVTIVVSYWTTETINWRRKKQNSPAKESDTQQFLKENKWYNLENAEKRSLSPTQRSFQKYVSLPSSNKQKTRWKKNGSE